MTLTIRRLALLTFPSLIFLALPALSATPAPEPIRLRVDMTDAPRRLLHVRQEIPVRPGKVRLFYPKWIPGDHAPTGPIASVAGITIPARGLPLEWRRDLVEMYAIYVTIPAAVRRIDVAFDFLMTPEQGAFGAEASSTDNLAVLQWSQTLLYPSGVPAADLTYLASVRLPAGWKYGTALPVARESGGWVEFKPADLVTLIDSPLNAGRWFRTIALAPEITPKHYIHLAGDSRESVDIPDADRSHLDRLVREAHALFGAHHYRDYHFLYTLSDQIPFFGLEHHESSDNRAPERSLIDKDARLRVADLLAHEFAHSWNGKHRRPADLTTPDFEAPMKDDLLWVYEGLTQYLGWLLATRSGFLTPEESRSYLAEVAADEDNQPGRAWRPLVDTAVSAQFLYGSGLGWTGWRRNVEYYNESLLFWLEADAIIRAESHGQRSLDNFCRRFHGGMTTGPEVKTYTFEDVVATMNEVQPYDWKTFFTDRVERVRAHAPLAGITRGGWKLAFADSATAYAKSLAAARKRLDLRYSLGVYLSDKGEVLDVWPQSPAGRAGLAPGMKLIAINGKEWSDDVQHDAIRTASRSRSPIEFLAKNGDFYSTHRVEYTGGERYPRLDRAPGPDLLDEDLAPLASK